MTGSLILAFEPGALILSPYSNSEPHFIQGENDDRRKQGKNSGSQEEADHARRLSLTSPAKIHVLRNWKK
jgi:hypothetical protein